MLKKPNINLILKTKYWRQLQNWRKLKFLLQKGCEKWQMFGLLLNFIIISFSFILLVNNLFYYYEFVQFYSQLDLCFEYLCLDTTLLWVPSKHPSFQIAEFFRSSQSDHSRIEHSIFYSLYLWTTNSVIYYYVLQMSYT